MKGGENFINSVVAQSVPDKSLHGQSHSQQHLSVKSGTLQEDLAVVDSSIARSDVVSI